jgi:hypothetical protein
VIEKVNLAARWRLMYLSDFYHTLVNAPWCVLAGSWVPGWSGAPQGEVRALRLRSAIHACSNSCSLFDRHC